MGLLCKIQPILPRRSLMIIYKSFTQPHFGYEDVIYDQLPNASFSNKTESMQNNVVLAVTEAIKGSYLLMNCIKN